MSLLWTDAAYHFGDREYYHASPYHIPEGSTLYPGGPHGANFDNDRSGHYVYMTPSFDRAEQYHYHLWEQGHENAHIYMVHPHGPVEEDPHDSESVRTKGPAEVVQHLCAHDEDE